MFIPALPVLQLPNVFVFQFLFFYFIFLKFNKQLAWVMLILEMKHLIVIAKIATMKMIIKNVKSVGGNINIILYKYFN